ncbi:MAG: hypothetical protein O2857_15150 [Planctomycetota bacterium]|nr:hypothetical protein [Planctomycetota bacterium]
MLQTSFSLDVIQVASPCPALWDEMEGDGLARHCAQCNKNVYNISGMSREDAESLIQEKEGRLCMRFFQRADGTILTKDCPVGLRAFRMRLLKFAASIAAAFFIMFGSYGTLLAMRHSVETADIQEFRLVETFRRWLGLRGEVIEVAGDICVPEER